MEIYWAGHEGDTSDMSLKLASYKSVSNYRALPSLCSCLIDHHRSTHHQQNIQLSSYKSVICLFFCTDRKNPREAGERRQVTWWCNHAVWARLACIGCLEDSSQMEVVDSFCSFISHKKTLIISWSARTQGISNTLMFTCQMRLLLRHLFPHIS